MEALEINEIKRRSKWILLKDMGVTIDSHTQNPNGKNLIIPQGTIITWEDDAPNGNVWFNFELNGVKYRGKKECGRIFSVINDGYISLQDNGNSFTAYDKDFCIKYLK
jgi:hypothetical protein